MKNQFSSGVVIYRKQNGTIEYLVLHYQKGHWDFPKGKIENGETKKEAALRELKEETGLVASLVPDFEDSFSYFFHDDEDSLIQKTVYFFIGYLLDNVPVKLSCEHKGFMWLEFNQALEQLTYQNARDLLIKVHSFIQKL